MFVIRKKLKFECAHRLVSCYSKACSDTIHGHSYVVEVFFKSKELNEDGMVVDFGKIKDKLKDFIEQWDHALILHIEDPHQIELKKSNKKVICIATNPTAENMAYLFYKKIKDYSLPIWKVRIHETDTGYAEYFEEEKTEEDDLK